MSSFASRFTVDSSDETIAATNEAKRQNGPLSTSVLETYLTPLVKMVTDLSAQMKEIDEERKSECAALRLQIDILKQAKTEEINEFKDKFQIVPSTATDREYE